MELVLTTDGPLGVPAQMRAVNAHEPADAKRKKSKPALPAPIRVVEAILKAFSSTHRRCKADKVRGLARSYCREFGHKLEECPTVDYRGDSRRWWAGPETGLSSMALCRSMAGNPPWTVSPMLLTERDGRPHDPDDFSRYYKLLKAFPEFRARIGEVAALGGGWEKLAPAWDETERLCEEESPSGWCSGFYALMKSLPEEA